MADRQTSRLRQQHSSPWTEKEDLTLSTIVLADGSKPTPWCTVANHLPGRTPKECRKRWCHQDVKKGAWTASEDDLLREAFKQHGNDWTSIACCVPRRSGDQCSKRWRDALDPSINRSPWTPAEDQLLLSLAQQHGNNWEMLASFLDNRRGLQCRNRWCFLTAPRNTFFRHRTSLSSDAHTRLERYQQAPGGGQQARMDVSNNGSSFPPALEDSARCRDLSVAPSSDSGARAFVENNGILSNLPLAEDYGDAMVVLRNCFEASSISPFPSPSGSSISSLSDLDWFSLDSSTTDLSPSSVLEAVAPDGTDEWVSVSLAEE